MKIFQIIGLTTAIALSGCAQGPSWQQITSGVAAVENFKITQDQLDTARNAYVAGFQIPAREYLALPRCPSGVSWTLAKPCADHSKVAKIKAISAAMEKNFIETQKLVSNGVSGSGMQTAWTLLRSGITTATALMGS